MLQKILNLALFSSLFLLFTALSGFDTGTDGSDRQHQSNDRELKYQPSDSLSQFVEYEDNLSSLVSYFKAKGFEIEELLQDTRFEIYEDIDDRFIKSAERKSPGLEEYKKILGFEKKSAQIVEFINEHHQQLEKAEQKYGISKFVISAILGVETAYGQYVGEHNPFNAYVSMYALGYRADFAKAQLEQLLIFTRNNDLDVLTLKSSYAGAMSFAQFIPYSLNKWFVGDDLYNMDNNILSVANYLSYFKERTGNIETAVLRYNPSDLYRDAVLALAKAGEAKYLAAS